MLSDHCHERPPVLKDQIYSWQKVLHFNVPGNWTCRQRPPVLKDNIWVSNRVVFQDRFHGIPNFTQGSGYIFLTFPSIASLPWSLCRQCHQYVQPGCPLAVHCVLGGYAGPKPRYFSNMKLGLLNFRKNIPYQQDILQGYITMNTGFVGFVLNCAETWLHI